MSDFTIWWDLDDDPDGNVQHIAEHDLSVEEVEDVLRKWLNKNKTERSRQSGLPMTSVGRLPGVTSPLSET